MVRFLLISIYPMNSREDEMAKAEQINEESVAKPKKKTALILAIALLTVGAGVGGGAYFYLYANPGQAAGKHEVKGPPVYIKLEPAVVNISNGIESYYLQVGIDLKTFDPEVEQKANLLMPELRDGILTLLAGQDPHTVTQPAEREKLRQKVKGLVNRLLMAHGAEKGKEPINGVFFTAFVMQ